MNTQKKPTAQCDKRASVKYQRKFERLNLLMETGTKARIKQAHGEISLNAYINGLINADLCKQEKPAPDDIFKPIF